MRVALVCPYDLGSPGGVQVQVLGLADALRTLGHEADVLAPGRHLSPGTVPVGRAIPIRVNGSTARMAPHPAAARRTVHRIRQGDYDVVHLHEPLAPSITIPALLVARVPVVGTFHAAGDRTPYRWLDAPLRRLAAQLHRRVAVSEPAARLATRHLGGAYETLFNAVDPAAFGPASAPADRAPVVLFLGRHEPRKGLEVLLEATSMLPVEVNVWVGGDGPDTLRLRRRHSSDSRVQWLGRLSDAEKCRRLACAAVLCVPSLGAESFGVVLLEAMAAGTPVVASDIDGYRWLAAAGAAHLVPPGDAAVLAAGLLAVVRDPVLATELQAAGRRLAAGLTFDALARRYLDIYGQRD